MKLKSSLFILAATAGLVATSSAYVVDVVGSTAGRTAVINHVLTLVNETSVSYSGASVQASNQSIITGTYGGNAISVRFNFTGSAAGVQQVSQQLTTVSFYKTTVAAGVVAFSGGNIETSAAEIGYSDVFQTTTSFTTPALTIEDEVAVIPFKFYKTENGAATLTNITSQQVRQLYGANGDLPLSMFTGNAADTASVYATGRDAASGTRITTFAETGTSQTAVSQYQPTVASGAITALGSTSTSGFSSGSNVAGVVGATFSGGTVVGYLGASDWTTADTNLAVALSFNGVPYSTAALYNGQYTFWGYLHQFHQGVTGNTLTFYNALRDALVASPGSGVEPLSSMAVDRLGDGFPVRPAAL
jgi:hypothetical protein